MLNGKNVRLREVRESDIELFLKWFNDPEVTQYLTIYLPMTEKFEREYIENLSGSDTNITFIIEVKPEGSEEYIPIGNCGLHKINWKDRDGEAGMVIGEKEYWNNGYGTEAAKLLLQYAFEQLNLNRVSSNAIGFNARSVRAQEKAGFKKEGVARKAMFRNGKYWDKVCLGILATEWRKIRK